MTNVQLRDALNQVILRWREKERRHEEAVDPDDRYLNMTESDAHALQAEVYRECADALADILIPHQIPVRDFVPAEPQICWGSSPGSNSDPEYGNQGKPGVSGKVREKQPP